MNSGFKKALNDSGMSMYSLWKTTKEDNPVMMEMSKNLVSIEE